MLSSYAFSGSFVVRSRSRISLMLSMTEGAGGVGVRFGAVALTRKSSLYRTEQDLADRQVAVAFVGALDDVPRRHAGRRLAQQMLPQLMRLAVKAKGAPVVLGHLPLRARIALERCEPRLLFRFRKMDPGNFSEQCAN